MPRRESSLAAVRHRLGSASSYVLYVTHSLVSRKRSADHEHSFCHLPRGVTWELDMVLHLNTDSPLVKFPLWRPTRPMSWEREWYPGAAKWLLRF
jgi:hypothetical protein